MKPISRKWLSISTIGILGAGTPSLIAFAEEKKPEVYAAKTGEDEAIVLEEERIPPSGDSSAPAVESAVGPAKNLEKEAGGGSPTSSSKDPKKNPVKGEAGDTYNFYFQKAPGPQKVQQGGNTSEEKPADSSAVYVPPKPETPIPLPRRVPFVRSADLYLGVGFVPDRSSTGLAIGADFMSSKPVGFRLEVFEQNGPEDGESSNSFSANGTLDTSSENRIVGGNIGLQLNVHRSENARFAPMLGVMLLNEKTTTTTSSFGSFGSEDVKTSSSKSKVLPYAGAAANIYFTEHFGATASILIPSDPKHSILTIGIAVSI